MSARYRFIGTVRDVSRNGDFAFIYPDEVTREDGGKLGLIFEIRIFLHKKAFRIPSASDCVAIIPPPLTDGMQVSFLIGSDPFTPGKLTAERVRPYIKSALED